MVSKEITVHWLGWHLNCGKREYVPIQTRDSQKQENHSHEYLLYRYLQIKITPFGYTMIVSNSLHHYMWSQIWWIPSQIIDKRECGGKIYLAAHFGLQITSYDCNITTSVLERGNITDSSMILPLLRWLPFRLGSFIRYNRWGWAFYDKCQIHLEFGDAWVHALTSTKWLYLSEADAVKELFSRRRDFIKPVGIYSAYSSLC